MKPTITRLLLALALFLGVADRTAGQDPFDPFGAGGPLSVKTKWSVDGARPGDLVVLAVIGDIDPGWHINANQSQMAADSTGLIATEVKVTGAPPWVTPESVRFPPAHQVTFAGVETQAFEGRTVFFIPVKVTDTAPPGEQLKVAVEIYYQACDDSTCLNPATLETSGILTIVEPSATVAETDPELFAGLEQAGNAVGFDVFGLGFSVDPSSWGGLLLLLVVAAFGGLLLNFTPCVLPVIPIKIMSMSKLAGNRSKSLALGTSMSVGVIAFWLGLAVPIIAVSGFTATNQLFQYPWFTITIGVVIVALAIGMCGLFSVRLPNFVYGFTPNQETLAGSFGLGIMTAILSTPCTAPFMGAAAAWAAGQDALITLSTFGAIGVGMALPYFVLSAAPGMVKKMPRSGPASALIKEVMGLFLLAAGVYFIGTGLSGMLVTPPDPPTRLHWWPVMGLSAAAGLWLAYRTIRITTSPVRRLVFGALGLLLVVGSAVGVTGLTGKGPVDWVYFTEERFQAALDDNKVVVMDFTAEWCLNCKALEHNVLYSEAVAALLNSEDVVAIKVDITGNNPAGKRMLENAGSLTIPLLAVYRPDPAGPKLIFKSDAYTPSQVIAQIRKALAD